MELKISLARVISPLKGAGWVQIHDFIPEGEQKLKKRGRLIALIAVSDQGDDSARIAAGREVLTRLHEEYFGNLEQSSFSGLKNALEKVAGEFSNAFTDLEITAISYLDGAINAAAVGGSRLTLLRSGGVADLLIGKSDQVVTASGYPQDDDVLILGNQAFFSLFNQEKLSQVLSTGDLIKAQEEFTSAASGESETNPGAALVYFSVKRTEPDNYEKGVEDGAEENFKTSWKETVFGQVKRLGEIIPRRKIRIKERMRSLEEKQGKKTTLSVGVILLIILITSLIFGVRQKKVKDRESEYTTQLQAAAHDYEEAIKLAGINAQRSRELIQSSREVVDDLFTRGITVDEVNELKNKLDEAQEAILREYRLDASLFVDLGLLSSGFEVIKLAAGTEDLVALDRSGEKVAAVTIEDKNTRIIAGPDDLKEIVDIGTHSGRFMAMKADGIYEIDNQADRVIEGNFSGSQLFYVYAGNVYLLDKLENKIYRYTGAGDSYSSRQDWLAPGVTLDFSNAVGWAIDGSVWIGFGQDVDQILQGAPQSFSLGGVVPAIAQLTAIFTNDELGNLYLLESSQKRVVVVNKDGEFQAQYLNEEFSKTNTFVVSESQRKIIFPVGGKLMEMELKHLQ